MSSPRFFVIEKRILKILGISFAGNESWAYKIYSVALICLFNVGYGVLDFRELFVNDFEIAASKIITYEFGTILSIGKTFVAYKNRIKLGKILDKIEKELFVSNPKREDAEQKLLDECLWITQVQTYVYYLTALLIYLIRWVAVIVGRVKANDPSEWELPFGPFSVLNATRSPNYEITFVYQSLSLTFIASHFLAIDLIAAGVLVQLSYQFKILQNNIRSMVKNARKRQERDGGVDGDNEAISWKYLQLSLGDFVRHHLLVTDIAEEIEELFKNLFLFLFFNTMIMLCFDIYYESNHSMQNLQSLVTMIEGIAAILQLFLICFWGQQITNESYNVGFAAYESDFVGTDLRFQKSLIFVIRRCQDPVKVTAGRLADIGLATFAWILRTSYSAFNIVQRKNTNAA